ncbi:MAG: arylsulfatase [Woeseiaceae bacterium]
MCRRRKSVLCGALTVLFLLGCEDESAIEVDRDLPAERPNILLVVVDDMGFADLGSFGSEIPTPNLDKLAYAGVRLTNFIAGPACSPTRAMLLTGVDAHRAGFGNLKEELAPNQRGKPGFEGYLPDNVITVASLLRDGGYRTYMTGKWHLGVEASASPAVRGFDKSFAMMINASHFADMRPAYHPDPDAKAEYRENDVVLEALPSDFEYSSQYYVDHLIDYLDEDAGNEKPFFAYLAFSAPHWPLQAPDDALERFRGKYDEGYDVALERRLNAQKKLGLLPSTAQASGRAPKGRPWDALSDAEKRVEARGMEVYAAMVAEIDRHSGRLVEYLRQSGQLDNTVIIFLSDNGAEGHDYDDTWPAEAFPAIRKSIDDRHDFSYENMGRQNSYTLYGPNWARVSAPAFRLYKAFPTEGGVRAPAFVHFPGRFASETISHALVLAKDIASTILEIATVKHPGSEYSGRAIEPMTGVSAVSVFEGQTTPARITAPRVHADELIGKRGIRRGEWKLVHMPKPYGNGDWQLYNLVKDPAESVDLAADMPELVAELAMVWEQYAEDNGVVLPDWVSGY